MTERHFSLKRDVNLYCPIVLGRILTRNAFEMLFNIDKDHVENTNLKKK